MTMDIAGRIIAPDQHEPQPRPDGPWTSNGVYATFGYMQDDYDGGAFAIYTVHGGAHDLSSVSAETLRALGIAVPMEPRR